CAKPCFGNTTWKGLTSTWLTTPWVAYGVAGQQRPQPPQATRPRARSGCPCGRRRCPASGRGLLRKGGFDRRDRSYDPVTRRRVIVIRHPVAEQPDGPRRSQTPRSPEALGTAPSPWRTPDRRDRRPRESVVNAAPVAAPQWPRAAVSRPAAF